MRIPKNFETIYDDEVVNVSWRRADGMLRISKQGTVMREVRPPRPPRRFLIIALALLVGGGFVLLGSRLKAIENKVDQLLAR